MVQDIVFQSDAPRGTDFAFDTIVAEAFDDMVARSVPLYHEQQEMVRDIAARFWVPGTSIIDLGCASGSTLVALAEDIGPSGRLVGYDNSRPMLDVAKRKIEERELADRIELRYANLETDPARLPGDAASVVLLCWTLQFIRPIRRLELIRWINRVLVDGGVLVVTEKVLAEGGCLNRFFIDTYYKMKRRNGYSDDEILRKRQALENVLIPYRIDENRDLFRRGGFATVDTFFQWFNFAGFVCLKEGG